MLGAMADAQYDNYEMGALDHAYTKALVSLVQQDAASVKKGSEKCIIPAGSFSKMNFLKNGRNRQTLWGGCTDANAKLLLNDT